MSQKIERSDQHEALDLESALEALRQSPEFRGPVEPLDDHDHSNDHFALIHESRDEQFAAAIPFMRQGLERGEQCLYIADENSREEVLAAMRADGLDVDAALESGALMIQTKQDTYLRDGTFDPDEMIAFLKDAIDDAIEEYEALRIAGEMTWVFSDEPDIEDLIEYEGKLNTLFPDVDSIALCQYNRERFPPEIIRDIVRTHPHLIHDNVVSQNVYYTPPGEFFGPDQPANEVDRMMGTLRERTEAKAKLEEREQDLEETVDQLQQSNDRLKQFAYAASHDLQEPLRMVSSYLQLLENQYGDDLDEDAKEYIDFAVDGADRMRAMVDDLLAFSRVEQSDGEFEPVDCDTVLEQVTDDHQVQIEENDAEIAVESLPTVSAVEEQLEQLFSNLVSNAIKYSGDEPPQVEITAEQRTGHWEFSVADDGIGIDPDKTDRIFEVFKRLHHDDEYQGTGIGLSLCQKIVKNHGGSIWVESEPGEGTTFSFTLPKRATD